MDQDWIGYDHVFDDISKYLPMFFWQMVLLSDTARLSHRADVQLSSQSVTWLADESVMFVARGGLICFHGCINAMECNVMKCNGA